MFNWKIIRPYLLAFIQIKHLSFNIEIEINDFYDESDHWFRKPESKSENPVLVFIWHTVFCKKALQFITLLASTSENNHHLPKYLL